MLHQNSPLTAVMCVALIVSSLACRISVTMAQMLVFLPAYTILEHNYMWNSATYVVSEPNLFLALLTLVVFAVFGSSVERSVGTLVLAKSMAFATLATSTLILILSAIVYRIGLMWLLQSFSGPWPCIAAVAVLKFQRSPSEAAFSGITLGELHLDGVAPWLQGKHLPLAWIGVAFVCDLLCGHPKRVAKTSTEEPVLFPGSATLLTVFGTWLTWFFLRYLVGDPSSNFGLHHMCFPAPLRTVALSVSTALFPCVQAVGLGSHVAAAAAASSAAEASIEEGNGGGLALPMAVALARSAHDRAALVADGSAAGGARPLLPGSTEADAERRRAIAIAALSARLQQAQAKRDEGS